MGARKTSIGIIGLPNGKRRDSENIEIYISLVGKNAVKLGFSKRDCQRLKKKALEEYLLKISEDQTPIQIINIMP
ncbi:MAG: hypothetical protein KGL39_33670 [Patescibacteria group bacterium]|nr:hypothetical protein [Patescibacteria group bacterium]